MKNYEDETHGYLQLSIQQIKDILERGYSYAIVEDRVIRFTADDLCILESDLEKFLEKKKQKEKK